MNVTVRNEEYQIVDQYSAAASGSKYFGKYVFILKRLSDNTMWRALGKQVMHNSVLIPHTACVDKKTLDRIDYEIGNKPNWK